MVNKSRELYFPSPVFIAAGGVSGNIPPTIDAAIGDITMPKIRVPASHTASFKSFCKQFSLKLESSSDTGIRLRGNKLLNIVAQSAGHKDYKALLMDTATYGDGPFDWKTLPTALAEPLAKQLNAPLSLLWKMLANAADDEINANDEGSDDVCLSDVLREQENYVFDLSLACKGDAPSKWQLLSQKLGG
jgi:hypothetical protein